MTGLIRLKNRVKKKILRFLQETFLQKKLNNWLGYIFIAAVALLFGYLLVNNMTIGVGIFAALAGFLVVIICMSNPETGMYVTITYCFFAYFIANISVYFFQYDMPVGLFSDILVVSSIIGLVIRGDDLRKNLNSFTRNTLVIFIFFTLFFSAIQFVNPNSRSLNVNILAFRKFVGYVFIMFLTFNILDSYEKIRKFLKFIFIICTLCALYGCKQEWFGFFSYEWDLMRRNPNGFKLIFMGGMLRKSSTMSDPASFGIVMAVCTVFYLIIAINTKNLQQKFFLVLGCIFMILAMFYSGTRTANAIVIVGFAFFTLLHFDKPSTRRFGIISAIIIAGLVYAPFYGGSALQRFRTTFTGAKDESYKVRLINRAFIQPFIRSHPIGAGLGTTSFSGDKEHAGPFPPTFQPDSGYVMRAAETGWSGLLEICVLYFIALYTGIRAFFRTKNEKLKAVAAACVTSLYAFYIAEFAQTAIGGISDAVIYYPILAIILKLKYIDEKESETVPAVEGNNQINKNSV